MERSAHKCRTEVTRKQYNQKYSGYRIKYYISYRKQKVNNVWALAEILNKSKISS